MGLNELLLKDFPKTHQIRPRSGGKKGFRHNLTGYLFIAPNLIGFALFTLIPVIFSWLVSFTEWNLFKGFRKFEFTGFKNYGNLFTDVSFTDSLKNNICFTLETIPLVMILALLVAVMLNKKVYGRNTIRAMFFIPYIANVVAISAVWMLLYNPARGPVNQFLMSLGVRQPPLWLASTAWALPSIIILSVWQLIGYNCVLYLAGLQGIPVSLYESADIDGAGAFRKLWNITIPMLSPTIFFLAITNIIASFQVFGPVNIMTQGGPGRATSVIAYYIYISGFRYFKMGYAASMAWFLFVAIFAVTLIQWKGQQKWANY